MAVVGDQPVDLTPEAHFFPVVIAAGTAAVVAAGAHHGRRAGP